MNAAAKAEAAIYRRALIRLSCLATSGRRKTIDNADVVRITEAALGAGGDLFKRAKAAAPPAPARGHVRRCDRAACDRVAAFELVRPGSGTREGLCVDHCERTQDGLARAGVDHWRKPINPERRSA